MRKTLLHHQTNNFGIAGPAICEQVVLMHGLKIFFILKDRNPAEKRFFQVNRYGVSVSRIIEFKIPADMTGPSFCSIFNFKNACCMPQPRRVLMHYSSR
jgi:hypothetical protein